MRAVRVIAKACEEYAETHALGNTERTRYKPLNIPIDLFSPKVTQSLRALYDLPWFWRVWW